MKVRWEVEDGYISGSRPHTTEVDDDELSECDTEEERQEVINDTIQNDFEQKISWSIIE